MKLSRCVIIYCTHLLGLQATRTRWVSGKDREAVAASMNTHHSSSTVIYGESCQSRGQMTFTHSYQRKISVDRDFRITSLFALRTPSPDSVCLSVCRCVCVCVLLTKTDIELVLGTEEHCWLHSMCVSLSLWECQTKCLCCDNYREESLHSQHDVEVRLALQSRYEVLCNEK